MNAKDIKNKKTPSAVGFEAKRFRRLFSRWLDYRLNKFFDLTIDGPEYRSIRVGMLGIGFIAFGFIIHSILFTLTLSPNPQASTPQTTNILLFAGSTLLRLVLILFIPAPIAIDLAGNYLTDIFELKDLNVAWKFIREISLSGATEVLHIRDGKIAEEDLKSPIVLIGGPGRVEMEFDSVALFERPDGTPHVIGPEVKKPKPEEDDENEEKGKKKKKFDNTILEGFERLREPIINLRDQYYGNPSAEAISIENRSLDGIKIGATDVRTLFSILRNDGVSSQEPTKERPFPYNTQSVEDLIYRQSVPVLSDGPHPSGLPPVWAGAMQGLVRSEINDFISQNKLAEFLSSISTPEIEAAEFREDTIIWQTLQYSSQLPDKSAENIQRPKFHPRTELSERFMRYTDGFSKRAKDRGFDLHWIGVGTWKVPDEISVEVNNRHLEAWRISRENSAHSNPKAFEMILDEAYLNEKLRLLQNISLDHQRDTEKYKGKRDKVILALLQTFWEQIGEALDYYYKNNLSSHELDELERAVQKIETLLNIPGGQHTIGGGSMSKVQHRKPMSPIDEEAPPAPKTIKETHLYRSLLAKLDGNFKVAEAMIANEEQRHPGLTRVEKIEHINKRLERYGK